MTITVNRRSLAVLAVAALGILLAYVLGTGRASAASATAAAPSSQTPVSTSVGAAALTRSAAAAAGSGDGITVTGTGKVTGTPDTLRISMSVNTTAPNVDDALRQANAAMAAVQKALRDRGVDARDLQTSGLSIQPNYKSSGTPDGYAVYENLTATVHDLSKAGSTLSAAAAAGGNAVRIDGVSVDLADATGLMGGARTAAMADAKAKAQQYATAAGRPLGQVVSVSEVVAGAGPQPLYDLPQSSAASGAASVPIQAGSQDVSVQVTVVYAFA